MQVRSGNVLTRSQALSKITREVGFPNPSPEALSWYFHLEAGKFLDDDEKVYYKPAVDFEAVGQVFRFLNLIDKWATVKDRDDSDVEKEGTLTVIKAVIKKYRLAEKEMIH